MSFFIDTHAHLYLPDFDNDRDQVVETALKQGVQKILLPNIDSSSISSMNNMVNAYPGICYAMMGLHPTSVKENFTDELEKVEAELKKGTYVGVGEIGIDLYWDKTFLQEQRNAFAAQLDLSLLHHLPVVIHARESFSEILDVLDGYKNKGLKGIFHAYTGDVVIAKKVTGMGFLLGIGGILTYKKSTLPEVVREIDLHMLVLETDSPYLTPVPHRGKRNESAYIPVIAEAIGQIKKLTLNDVASVTTENVLNLFSLDHG
ncbi:MAG: TatD family hydrolase [Bacteroidales bacterium]|nr:TatD family hydrolase [Bacteroidales bacterium]